MSEANPTPEQRDHTNVECPKCHCWRWGYIGETCRSEGCDGIMCAKAAPITSNPMVPIKALQDLYRAYVSLLESAKERIEFHGGTCDSVEQMERGDPYLIAANVAMEAARIEAKHSAPETSGNETERLRAALAMIYDKWEDGTPCYEDPEDFTGHLGNAVKLTAEEEMEILALIPTQRSPENGPEQR